MPDPSSNTGNCPLPGGIAALDGLVASEPVRDAFRFFDHNARWIDEQHLTLCRIPAPTFHERTRAEWFLEQFSSFGLSARLDRAGNVLALPSNAPRSAPLIAVTAHLDTVLAPSNPAQIEFARGKLHGPGVSDNGAGLAALLALARAFAGRPLSNGSASLLFVANVGEEGEGNLSGMRFLCRPSPLLNRIRSFVVLDGPSVEHITSEALACRRFDISLTGPGGHSWADHGTANPVHALSRLITTFVDVRAELNSSERCSFNFGVVDGGSTVNAIPSSARAKVDLRSSDPVTLDGLVASLTEAAESAEAAENRAATAGRVTASIRETGSRPGGKLRESACILNYIRAVDQFLGIRSWSDCASTDANVPLSLGLDAISIGAGGAGGGAHTPGEWYSCDGRALGLRRITLLLSLLLADLDQR